MCRFINADDISYLDPETIGGLNLYTYCLNNPISYYDPSGRFPILIALILGGFALIGAGIGGKVAYDNAVDSGKTGSDLFWSTVGGVFVGASIGLAAGVLIIATAGAAAGVFGAAGLATSIFGITALQAFAIGALAYNFVALIIAPIIGITMEPIEGGGPSYKPPKPGETPRHPASKKYALQTNKFFSNQRMKYYLWNSGYLFNA